MKQTGLSAFVPHPRLSQADRIRVRAAPAQAWKIVRGLDINEIFIARLLFSLRTIPELLNRALSKNSKGAGARARIDDFTGKGKGFQILSEAPGQEIIVGAIGKFWKGKIDFIEPAATAFASFKEAGYGKVAWSLRVDPDSHGGSWISWELKVDATDDASWKAFSAYWRLIGPFSHFLRRLALRNFLRKLGGAPSEEQLRLPEDSLIPRPRYQRTMSVTIEAAPEKIWPWLAQMGCQRAGWYSIDRLDNAGIPSAFRIIPELQNISVGDILPWRPQGKEGFAVLAVEKNRSIVLGTPSLLSKKGIKTSQKAELDDSFADTWAFVLEPIGERATRLLTRVRADFEPSAKMSIMGKGFEAAHVIMQRSQLKNLKHRAEKF
jgi:hypothetical protein